LEKIRIYIDEDLSDLVAVALNSKGFNVTSAHEVNMRGKSDEEQLKYALKHKRVILTRNIKHFVELQRKYYKMGIQHNGILVTNYLPLKELIKRLIIYLNKQCVTNMVNSLDWLHNYK